MKLIYLEDSKWLWLFDTEKKGFKCFLKITDLTDAELRNSIRYAPYGSLKHFTHNMIKIAEFNGNITKNKIKRHLPEYFV